MRLTTKQTFSATGVASWVCPAGVTSVLVIPGRSSVGSAITTGGVGTLLTVVPNTTYSLTIGAGQSSTPSTFSSTYSCALGGQSNGSSGIPLTLVWMDG